MRVNSKGYKIVFDLLGLRKDTEHLAFCQVCPPFLLASELGLGLATSEPEGLIELDRFILTYDI